MKKISLFAVFLLFSGAAIAGSDAWHSLSGDKSPHAKGGCASKDKVAKFHKFHGDKQSDAKLTDQQHDSLDKKEKTPSLDQFI